MTMWYDDNNRRGVLSVAVLLFLAAEGASTVSDVTAGVPGMTERRAKIMLDRLVEAGGATESDGSYTGVLAAAGG